MSKRLRYTGPFEVEALRLEDGRVVEVKRNGLLPEDVPAKVRDELAERGDDWSWVKSETGQTAEKKEG